MAIRNYRNQTQQPQAEDGFYNPQLGGGYAEGDYPGIGESVSPFQRASAASLEGAPPAPPTSTYEQFNPNTQTDDINRMWRDNRTDNIAEGDAINADLQKEADYRGGLEGRYRGPMEGAYSNLQQTPGYTPDETEGIVRNKQFNDLITPNSQFDSLNPNDEETAGIKGDPSSYDDYYDPDLTRQIDTNSANMQRGQVQGARSDIGGALDTQEQAFTDAIDPTQLGVSGDYYKNTSGALNDSTGQIRGAIDPGKLRYDEDVADSARFTDQDVNDWQAQAGNTVRNRYASAKDDLTRSAAASGNADALAVAAGRSRLENQEAVGAADAVTNARIGGRQAKTQRDMDLEAARLDAERGYAGLKSANEQTIGDRTLGQANANESLRLGANRDIANRRMDAATTTGANRLAGYKFLGDLGTNVEQGIGTQESGTQRYLTDTGTGIKQAQDMAGSDRAAGLYNTRANIGKYGIDTKFGQGMGVNTQLSNANAKVADARRTGEGEYRGWLTDQTGAAQKAGETARGQRIQNYGTQAGATNDATRGVSNWEIGNQDNTVFNKALRGMTAVANYGKVMGGG